MQLNPSKGTAGFSLIDVMIAAVILAGAFGAFYFAVTNQTRSSGQAALLGESVDVNAFFIELMDCARTFSNSAGDPTKVADCAAATAAVPRYIEVRDDTNAVILARYTADPTAPKFGKLLVRARCIYQNGFNSVLVEYRKDGINPLTNKMDTWRVAGTGIPLACP